MSESSTYVGIIRRALRPSSIGMAIVGLTALAAISLSGCRPNEHGADSSGKKSVIDQLVVRHEHPDQSVEAQALGRKVYNHYCQICHGPEAQGNGFNAAMLKPPPRNFADEAFWSKTDDAHLQKVISQGGKAGGKSVLMPAWGRTLNEQQIHDVIAFLHTVPKLAKQAETAQPSGDNAAAE